MKEMHEYDCMMTLALPLALEEPIIDFLLEHPEWVGGFSSIDAQGMGRGAGLKSAMEKVQGRARRRLIQLLLRSADIPPLVEAIRKEFHTPEVAYWVAPLMAFGRAV